VGGWGGSKTGELAALETQRPPPPTPPHHALRAREEGSRRAANVESIKEVRPNHLFETGNRPAGRSTSTIAMSKYISIDENAGVTVAAVRELKKRRNRSIR
jgi:hypothetical protein